MTRSIDRTQLIAEARIVSPPAAQLRACDDHSFELPGRIYLAMGVLFAGAIGVLATAFSDRMLVSYGVVFAFLVAFFTVPAMFAGDAPLSWGEFRRKGIATATGRTQAGEATVLVLILPFLILCWAIAIAAIAAVVH